MNWYEKTIDTYDSSASDLAEYFKSIGPRTDDIRLGLRLSGAMGGEAKVLEIGCGDGRDAAEIVKRAADYVGVDPSKGLLAIARKSLPDAKFVQSDALNYDYPGEVDVIFAFASLLHVDKDDMQQVLKKASESLRAGGIYYISLKEKADYGEEIKIDKYGERKFYFYNLPIIRKLSAEWFNVVHESRQQIGNTNWFTVALKRL